MRVVGRQAGMIDRRIDAVTRPAVARPSHGRRTAAHASREIVLETFNKTNSFKHLK